jgi:hypothetical protein
MPGRHKTLALKRATAAAGTTQTSQPVIPDAVACDLQKKGDSDGV